MINRKLLIALLVAASALVPAAITSVQAQGIHVEIGDRGYYNHGNYYMDHGRRMVWVPGHWTRHHRVWVHGHYERRGGGAGVGVGFNGLRVRGY